MTNSVRYSVACSFAIILALLATLIARLLLIAINFFTHLFYFQTISTQNANPWDHQMGYVALFLPALGGIMVGLLARFGSSAILGHGIPEAMESILTKNCLAPRRLLILKPLSSAIAIGSGGPFGAEGPIIATGGALGSLFARLPFIYTAERKVILAAGAAAGMSAIFGTPLAATLLSIELLLFEFRARSYIPVTLAAVLASVIRYQYFDSSPFFNIQPIQPIHVYHTALFALVGIIFGLISIIASQSVYWVEEKFSRLPIHWMWWPALGGLIVGIIGLIEPRSLGVGYVNIQDGIDAHIPIYMACSILIWKFLAWSISLGSGTSGGTLAPLMTIGSLSGFIIGHYLHLFAPDVNVSLVAIVGMAAVFAGASRGLLASILFALESTQNMECLIPLIITCSVAYIISHSLMEHTIMTQKIARRNISVPHEYFALFNKQ